MGAVTESGRNPVSIRFSRSVEYEQADADGTAEPVLRDQVLRRERLWSPFLFVFS